jgi:hypothetical protein
VLQWSGSACSIDVVEAECLNGVIGISCACPALISQKDQSNSTNTPSPASCGPSTGCGQGLGSLSFQCEQRMNADADSPDGLRTMQVACGVAPKSLTPATPIAVSMTLPGDVAAITSDATVKAAFESAFATDIATVLGIIATRIFVTSITAGSIVASYTIAPAADGTQLSNTAVETRLAAPITFNAIKNSTVIPSSITAQYASPVTATSTVSQAPRVMKSGASSVASLSRIGFFALLLCLVQ